MSTSRSVCGVGLFVLGGVVFLSAQTQPNPTGTPVNAGQIGSPSDIPAPQQRSGKSPEDYDPLLDPPHCRAQRLR